MTTVNPVYSKGYGQITEAAAKKFEQQILEKQAADRALRYAAAEKAEKAGQSIWQRATQKTRDFFSKNGAGKAANITDDVAKTPLRTRAFNWMNTPSENLGKWGGKLSGVSDDLAAKAIEKGGTETIKGAVTHASAQTAGVGSKALGILGKIPKLPLIAGGIELAIQAFEFPQALKEGRGGEQLANSSIKVAATGASAFAGMKAGALIGTAIGGPIGTAVGAVAGLGIGIVGSWLGGKVADGLFSSKKQLMAESKAPEQQTQAIANPFATQTGTTGQVAIPGGINSNNQYLAALLANDPQFAQQLMAQGLL